MSKGLWIVAAVIGASSVPIEAQAPPPNPRQQTDHGQPADEYRQPIYGKPVYGYSENALREIVDRLLGGRYNVSDRTAVEHCAIAAMQQAAVQYQPSENGPHPYGQGYNPAATMRVTAITNVQRREDMLLVSGVIDSRLGHPHFGYTYSYQSNGYVAPGELSFGCDIDYRGIVSNLRVQRANVYRG